VLEKKCPVEIGGQHTPFILVAIIEGRWFLALISYLFG
jgi:hypothetical protein